MAALLAIAMVGAAAGSAQAATLSSWTSYRLTYKSEPGEVNDMTMAWTATHMVLTDAGATIDLEDNYFMRQCTQSADRHSVSCPSVPGANWTSVTLGEEDDRLKVARGDYYAHRVYVDAGAGDDVVDVPLGRTRPTSRTAGT